MADTPKPAAKKAPAKKVAKKAVVTKVAKKTVLKKAPAKKAAKVAKKAVPKKTAVKKAASRKAAASKSANAQNLGSAAGREKTRMTDQAKALGDQVLKSSQRVTTEASETLQLAARQARRFSTDMFSKGLDLAKKHPAEAAGLAAAATALAAAIAKARKK